MTIRNEIRSPASALGDLDAMMAMKGLKSDRQTTNDKVKLLDNEHNIRTSWTNDC